MRFFTASLLAALTLAFTSAQPQPPTCSDPTYAFCCGSYLKFDNPIVKAILGSSHVGDPIMGVPCERVQGEVTAATTCPSGKTLRPRSTSPSPAAVSEGLGTHTDPSYADNMLDHLK
ncbi:MAG: hypothetical protein JOS17DRAFT_778285 [Linnemannia elongata]|nr:MAG: hypothetical protein JOS17DRAFT_778285 [Linnemannia elongata]